MIRSELTLLSLHHDSSYPLILEIHINKIHIVCSISASPAGAVRPQHAGAHTGGSAALPDEDVRPQCGK